MLGSFMLVWQTVFEETAQTVLVVAGFAALGVTGSGIAQRWLEARLGPLPPPPPPQEEDRAP